MGASEFAVMMRGVNGRIAIDMPDLSALPSDAPSFVSLYSGCGGLDLGFVSAGFRPLWANDFDKHACKTYSATLGPHVVCGSITEVELPDVEHLDVLVGGPPCQGFSVAGQMRDDDPRSRHVFHYMDVVERLRPKVFVLENVKALASNVRWESVKQQLLQRAIELGYSPHIMILNSAEFGVAQRRERMFLVGSLIGAVEVPTPLETSRRATVGQALDCLERVGSERNPIGSTARISPAKNPVLRTSAFRGSLLFNGKGRPLDLDDTAPTIPASMGGNATPIVDQHRLEGRRSNWVRKYHAGLVEGGAAVTSVPDHLRRITVAEAAILQSFPIGMTFRGPLAAQYRQVGNAVPPLLAKQVALQVAGTLARQSQPLVTEFLTRA